MSLTLTITEIRPQKEINFKSDVARAIMAACGSTIEYEHLVFFKGMLAVMRADDEDRKDIETIVRGLESGKTYRAEECY